MKGLLNNQEAVNIVNRIDNMLDNRLHQIYNLGYKEGYKDALEEATRRIGEYIIETMERRADE